MVQVLGPSTSQDTMFERFVTPVGMGKGEGVVGRVSVNVSVCESGVSVRVDMIVNLIVIMGVIAAWPKHLTLTT